MDTNTKRKTRMNTQKTIEYTTNRTKRCRLNGEKKSKMNDIIKWTSHKRNQMNTNLNSIIQLSIKTTNTKTNCVKSKTKNRITIVLQFAPNLLISTINVN